MSKAAQTAEPRRTIGEIMQDGPETPEETEIYRTQLNDLGRRTAELERRRAAGAGD